MPFDCDSVTGKITRSLMSSPAAKLTSISSPPAPDVEPDNIGARRKTRRRIDADGAVRGNEARSKCQGGHMAFADGTKAEDEAKAAFRRPGLIGMRARCSD